MDNPQDRVSKLLSDPENIKTIAKIASGLMSSQPNETEEAKKAEQAEGSEATSANEQASENAAASSADKNDSTEIAEVQSNASGAFSGMFGDFLEGADFEKSIGLLGALKPYLGSHKKQTCDMLIKALGAAKLFGMYKG